MEDGPVEMSVSRERIALGLVTLGLRSSASQRFSEGDYEPFDADWNYKDIPHLAEVHGAVDGVLIGSESNHSSSVLLQKVGPFRIPLIVYIGQGAGQNAVYVGSAGPFIIVIETTWESIGKIRTRVTTTYEVFSSRIMKFLHPLVHRLLSRNYDLLMKADLPMRIQRGRLRKQGYTFAGDTTGYGFRESSNVYVRNVITPAEILNPIVRVLLCELPEGRSLHGGDAEDGVVVERSGSSVAIYPRICEHEGASLDCAMGQEKGLRCPWHGRLIRPIASLDLASRTVLSASPETTAELLADELILTRRLQSSEQEKLASQ